MRDREIEWVFAIIELSWIMTQTSTSTFDSIFNAQHVPSFLPDSSYTWWLLADDETVHKNSISSTLLPLCRWPLYFPERHSECHSLTQSDSSVSCIVWLLLYVFGGSKYRNYHPLQVKGSTRIFHQQCNTAATAKNLRKQKIYEALSKLTER